VAAVRFRSQWAGDTPRSVAVRCATLAEIAAWLAQYPCEKDPAGFPPTRPDYAEQQARLLASVKRRFEAVVGQALTEADYSEAL